MNKIKLTKKLIKFYRQHQKKIWHNQEWWNFYKSPEHDFLSPIISSSPNLDQAIEELETLGYKIGNTIEFHGWN